ncbi:MAG: hypothetical protein ACTHM6_12775 [Tepidisphaeraceae bacterium]
MNRFKLHLPAAAVLLLGATCGVVRAAESSAVWEAFQDPLWKQSLAEHPDRLAGGVAPSGAVSVNHDWETGQRPDYFIEQQRYGADWLQAAIITHNDALLQQARRIIDWGFARQAEDGTFPGTGDPMHSTSFFVEAVARSILFTQHFRGQLPDWMQAWKPKLKQSAEWLANPKTVERYRKKALDPYTHRFFLHAAALAETAKAVGDDALLATAANYARQGAARLTDDGILPERGGFDVNYQTISVLFLNRYLLVCDDPALRQKLLSTLEAAYPQLAKRFGDDGIVDRSDSTRSQEIGRSGKTKTSDYKNAVQAFLMSAAATGDPRWHDLAAKIVHAKHWDPAPATAPAR